MFRHGNEGKGERVSSAALLGPGSSPPPVLGVHLPVARSAAPAPHPWATATPSGTVGEPSPDRVPRRPCSPLTRTARCGAVPGAQGRGSVAPRPGSPPAPAASLSLPGPGRLHPAALSAPFAREVPPTGRVLRHGSGQRHAAWGTSTAAAPAAPSPGTVGVPAGLRGPGHRPRVAAAARRPEPRDDGPQQREPCGKGGPGDKGAGSPGRAASGAGASPEPAPLSAAGTALRPAAGSPACLRRAPIYLLRLPTQRASTGGTRGSAPPARACACVRACPPCLYTAVSARHRLQRWRRGNSSGCGAGQSQTRGPGSAAGGDAVFAPSCHAEALPPSEANARPRRAAVPCVLRPCSAAGLLRARCGRIAGSDAAHVRPFVPPRVTGDVARTPGSAPLGAARQPGAAPRDPAPPPRLCVRSGSAHHAHLQPYRAMPMRAQILPAQLLCWRPQACIP